MIQISTDAEKNPVRMEAYVTTLDQVHTVVNAKMDLLELTVKQVSFPQGIVDLCVKGPLFLNPINFQFSSSCGLMVLKVRNTFVFVIQQ